MALLLITVFLIDTGFSDELIYIDKGTLVTATVTSIVDGDTIKVEYQGSTKTVRLLGINTPEIPNEPYAQEAKTFTSSLLNKEIGLLVSNGPGQEKDKYGRTLGVIFYEGSVFNVKLLEEGLAVRCFMANDVINFPLWEKKEITARKNNLNIWSSDTSGIVISEINPNPAPERDDVAEFVELYNKNHFLVDIGSWSLGSNEQTVIPQGVSIPAKGYIIIATNTAEGFRKIYPSTPEEIEIVVATGSLVLLNRYNPSQGLVIHLKDSSKRYQDSLTYNLAWDDKGADGTGKTLEKIYGNLQNLGDSSIGGFDDKNWAPSIFPKGTPGRPNSVSPNITLKKEVDKECIELNGTITYTITYKNEGFGTATNVVIIDVLPQKTELEAVSNPQSVARYYYIINKGWQEGFSENATKIKWVITSVAPGESGTISFTVRIK
ncbi:TPA: hypothetical protein DCX16_06395 [bacterium]|nr:hypothetical protein [bacterium]